MAPSPSRRAVKPALSRSRSRAQAPLVGLTPPDRPPALGSAVLRMQSEAGNRVVASRMTQGSGRRQPMVQGFWWPFGKQEPNVPGNAPDLTNRLLQWKDAGWVSFQMRQNWIAKGRDGATALRDGILKEAAAAGPDEQGKVKVVLDGEFAKLDIEEKNAVSGFETQAVSTVTGMLETSKKAITDEMAKYGFSEKMADGKGTGEAALSPTAEYAGLAAAAREIIGVGQKMVNKQVELSQKFKHDTGPTNQAADDEATQRAVMSDMGYVELVQQYEMLFSEKSKKYPILAAYRNTPLEVNAIAQGQNNAAGHNAAAQAGTVLIKKLHDIETTRANLGSGELSIYGLPQVVSVAKTQQGAGAGTLKARFIDDHAQKVKDDKAAVEMAIGAIGAAAMVVATIATAGGAAVVAGAAAGVGVGLSAATLYEHLGQFGAEKAAANTDMDRARAVGQSDPSMFWLAMDIAMFVGDVGQAAAMFMKLAGPIRGLMSLRQAAEQAGKVGDVEAARITEAYEKEVVPAARELPAAAQERVLKTVNPVNPAPGVAKAAVKVAWKWADVAALLKRTPVGQDVLRLIDKYQLNVIFSPTGATYYENATKSLFIAGASSTEDAMNAIVHEVEHADWRMTGKSAMNELGGLISKEDFIQKMCREEASAEARTIQNKYALQTLLNKPVLPTPTEEFYHRAFVEQAQALAQSSMSQDEKIAIAAQKGENALGTAFYQRQITTSVDGKDYFTYYGDMWEANKPPPTIPGGGPPSSH